MSYSVIRAELRANRQDILRLWQRNLSSHAANVPSAEDKYAWYYQNNPYGSSRCWLLRHNESGQLVGTAGLGLRKMKVSDRVVLSGLLVDFAVDKSHRSFLPARLLQEKVREAAARNLDLIYSSANNQAMAVLLRAGYLKLGEAVRYARVLSAEPYVRRLMKDMPGIRALIQPLNWALRITVSHRWRAVPKEFVARHIVDFDSRFDALWERAAPHFPLIAERTARFLRWRYTSCPVRKYSIFGLLSSDEKKVLGYIVYCFEQNTASIVDLFFENANAVLINLLSGFLRFASERKAASVSFSFMGSDEIRKALARFGFVRRDGGRAVQLFVRRDSELAPVALEQSNWYLVEGDQDNV